MKIKITDSEGGVLAGTLPTGWHDTPLAPYVALAAAKTMPDVLEATATLLGLPPEPFLADASLLVPIRRAAPWLFDGSLPDATEAVPTIHHDGKQYHHVGNLAKISGEQMEALLTFLSDHQGNPLGAAPAMLAVLYCPANQPQTAEVVAATAHAFETLGMAQAWPALAAFLRSSAKPALNIRTAWALEKELRTVLETLEAAAAPTSASSTFWQRLRFGLIRRWLRNAKSWL